MDIRFDLESWLYKVKSKINIDFVCRASELEFSRI